MSQRIDGARVTVLSSTTRLAATEITSPMDRFPEHRSRRASWYGGMEGVLLELRSEGATGVGFTQGGEAVAALLRSHLLPLVKGVPLENAADVEALWERCLWASAPYGSDGLAAHARSALDLAAWDLLGRMQGLPVYELLGAEARRIPVYATGDDIEHHLELGATASKVALQAGPWHESGRVEAVRALENARERAGERHGLMADAWMGLEPDFALDIAPALRELGFIWLEEPFPPEQTEHLGALGEALGPTRLATGEHVRSIEAMARLARSGVDILQPDLAWCGGLTAFRRMLAVTGDLELAPHLSATPWGMHAASLTDRVQRVEWYVESEPGQAWDAAAGPFRGVPVPVDGTIVASSAPGFGIEVDEDFVDAHALTTHSC